MLFLNESEIRTAVTLEEAIESMERAFAAFAKKQVTLPGVIHLDIPAQQGEVHVKGAHIHNDEEFAIKVATGFYTNRSRNLSPGNGMMMVFSATTGYPLALLYDHAYLTDLRTAAAGAVAAKYMAPREVHQAAVFGAGIQGRLQLQALERVRKITKVIIYDHHASNVDRYIQDMRTKTDAELRPASTIQDAMKGSSIVVTCTPSRRPFITGEMIQPGTHITAMGSDGPEKQELDTSVLVRADRIVADSLTQCARFGEIHHAVEAGLLKEEDVDGELGQVVCGDVVGRASKEEITVCDLTGVGVQDAAIAALVYRRAKERNLGREID